MSTTTKKRNPPRGTYPKKLADLWEKVYDQSVKRKYDKRSAAAIAWYVVKQSWEKNSAGKWIEIKKKKKTTKKKTTKKKTTKRKSTKNKSTKRKSTKRKSTKRKSKKK